MIDSLSRENVGVYQAEASNQDGTHRIRSKKFLVEIGSEANANTVNKLQDLDRNQGQQGRSGFARPANLIPVAAGALGTQVANNAQSSTQQDELLIANQLGGSSRWLQLQVTENTRMTVDTTGSSIDTLLAVYIPPQGVPLDQLQFNQLDFVDSDDDGAPDGLRSQLVELPVSAQECLIVVDGKNGATGDIQINYRLGDGPTITVQPAASASAAVGGQVSLSVTAGGSPAPSYQWLFNGEPIDTISNPSAATANLTLAGVELSHSGDYSVVVSNHMDTVTSSVSKLTVGAPPVITQQPTIQQTGPFSAGDTITLTVAATGEPAPSFRWRKDGQDLADGPNLSGSGTATLQIASAQSGDEGSYDVFIENTHGDATGTAVQVSLGAAPTLTMELTGQSQTVCEGSPATFMVAATGSPTPTFEWKLNDAVIPGQTGPTLTIAAAASGDAGVYTVKAVNMHGEAIGAASATLTVNAKPTIDLAPPSAVLVNLGEALTLQVQATGATSYEWKRNDVVLPGETGATLNVAAVQPAEAGAYTVTAINDCGRSTSATTQVSIRHLSNSGFANGKFGFQMDGSAGEVWIFEVAVDGNLGQWTEVGRVTLDGSGVPVSVSADPGQTYTPSLTIQGGRVTDNASDTMQGARIYRIRMAP